MSGQPPHSRNRSKGNPKRVLRGKPQKPETQKIIARFQQSDQTWRAFWESLTPEDRRAFEDEIDFEATYNDLLEEATPDDAALETIRKEMVNGFGPWAAHAIAKLSVEFYLRRRLEERSGAARNNTGPRASRYANREAAWIQAARAKIAAASSGATAAMRRRAAADAIATIETHASRRTITAFVTAHWHEIDRRRTGLSARKLSL